MQISKIVSLLQDKHRLFIRFLQIAEAMCCQHADALTASMQERLQLQTQIEAVDRQLEALYQECPAAREAASNRINVADLSSALRPVYEAGMQIHGILAKLKPLEPLIHRRLLSERGSLLQKIEEIQKTPAAAAHRYYRASHLTTTGNRFGRA